MSVCVTFYPGKKTIEVHENNPSASAITSVILNKQRVCAETFTDAAGNANETRLRQPIAINEYIASKPQSISPKMLKELKTIAQNTQQR